MLSRWFESRDNFTREVLLEVEYLRRLHGPDAGRIAMTKAARPHQRSIRRKVLQAAAARLKDG